MAQSYVIALRPYHTQPVPVSDPLPLPPSKTTPRGEEEGSVLYTLEQARGYMAAG